MYVEIFAKSDENEKSRGKRTWINTGPNAPSIALETSKPEHLERPEWHVVLKAKDWRGYGNGTRDGMLRDYNYSLEIHLTPADLKALVNFAVAEGLFPGVRSDLPQRK